MATIDDGAIHPGTDLKYRVTAEDDRFSLQDDNFFVVVKNSYGRVTTVWEKKDMPTDTDGGFYFMMNTVQQGMYFSTLVVMKNDSDFAGGKQHIVDSRWLCTVGSCARKMPPAACDTAVKYERVWTVNVGGVDYLLDSNGEVILDSNGNPIFVQKPGQGEEDVRLGMTAAELKHLLEERSANGRIDTLPELMDALGGVDDNTEVSLMTESDADDMMQRIFYEGGQ